MSPVWYCCSNNSVFEVSLFILDGVIYSWSTSLTLSYHSCFLSPSFKDSLVILLLSDYDGVDTAAKVLRQNVMAV